jgi:hypothetical protein
LLPKKKKNKKGGVPTDRRSTTNTNVRREEENSRKRRQRERERGTLKREHYEEIMLGYHGYGRILFNIPHHLPFAWRFLYYCLG